MSLTIPLALRLTTAKGDRHVTRDLHDLSFRTVVPGGYASASFTLSRPLNIQPEEIAEYGQVRIHDRRDGSTVWEGRLEDPGRAAGSSGEIWQVTAAGPAVYADDRTTSLIYVDSRMDGWQIGAQSTTSVDVSINDTAGVKMAVANGTTHGAGTAGLAVYHPIAYTGQQLARVTIPWTSGFLSSNYEVWLGTSLGTAATVSVDVDVVTGTPSGTLTGQRGGVNPITAGHDTVRLRLVRQVSNYPSGDDTLWVEFLPTVRALLMDVNGNDITSGYSTDTVLAEAVVRDLLGRFLNRYDGPNASIASTFVNIDQLAYPDGASARRVLDDLMMLEPAYYWAAWETGENGLHRFEWAEWPTTIRYEASTADGFDSPAASGDVYNAVSVRWRDGIGTSRVARFTSTVDILDSAGIVRESFVDLSDEVGSTAMATAVGNAFLTQHQTPMNQGTITIARPILDIDRGRLVQPWEIKPGNLIRVRNVLPRIDTLNATDRDGITVFKIAAVEFNAADASATLELDSYPLTVARAISDLAKRHITRKR